MNQLFFFEICAIFFVSFLTTILVLPALCHVAPKLGLMDRPNRRKVHLHPKPRIGGLGIVLIIALVAPLFIPDSSLRGLYVGMFMLTVVGFVDDHKELSHRWKFIAQALSAIAMIYFGRTILSSFGNVIDLGAINLGPTVVPVTIFCTVGVVNSINMIDGLDGLLGGVSLIAFASFAILAYINNQPELVLLSAGLSGAILAFLKYNWQPSKVFMGDAGSLSIGFILVFLSLAITQKENSFVPPVVPLLILAVPIVDAVTVIMKRMREGKSPFSADKNHIHHILVRLGFTKQNAVKIILLLSSGLASLGVIGTILKLPEHFLFLIFLAYVASYGVAAIYIKDVLEARIRRRRGRMEYRKPALLTTAIVRVLETLGKIKRKYDRYAIRMPVLCSFEEKFFKGAVLYIGLGGFSARFDQALSVGRRIDTDMLFMEGDKPNRLTATAEVVWSLKSNDWCNHGFKFIGLNQDQADTLTSFLEKFAVPSSRTGGLPSKFQEQEARARSIEM